MAEFFALVNIGHVHLDHRQFHALQRIVQRDRGVGQSTGIDDDSGRRSGRFLDPVDQIAFVIRLPPVEGETQRLCLGAAHCLDLGKACGTVNFRLTRTEKVKIWSVEAKDGFLQERSHPIAIDETGQRGKLLNFQPVLLLVTLTR